MRVNVVDIFKPSPNHCWLNGDYTIKSGILVSKILRRFTNVSYILFLVEKITATYVPYKF